MRSPLQESAVHSPTNPPSTLRRHAFFTANSFTRAANRAPRLMTSVHDSSKILKRIYMRNDSRTRDRTDPSLGKVLAKLIEFGIAQLPFRHRPRASCEKKDPIER